MRARRALAWRSASGRGQEAEAQWELRLDQTSAAFPLRGQLFPWTPAVSPTPPVVPPGAGRSMAGRGGGKRCVGCGGPRSRAAPLASSPPFSMSAHAPHCCGRHPLPQGSASQRSVAERSDDDFDFFSSAGAWGGRLFCFLDPSGEFSARQSSRRFPCFLMLL